jgi:hypothetical protein
MSKLDDIICKHMVDVDQYGFIAEEDERPCKEEVKALMLELVGEYNKYPSHYAVSDVIYDLREKLEAL